ncbi:hypothetical protein K3N28_16155 [Glycomyces sp. TRM65418]|uniref:hypothetical protein n=1 Tax=Glycomyces sp. TRM65418 TaxID=2867006 RepID=UPI001CE6B197|nr:hypothetical protein [Glycomyces sp. TRM65418]MCC3764593.1 hypothetical protein [Glycomyces sp. TRM65418]QZD54257.1 hypothetical protein K3N28_16070 [Glycomyces sp. TRM65418]
MRFPNDPFPAVIVDEDQARALERRLHRAVGPDAIPFGGEGFALFLDHVPGTWTSLGVREPGADITTAYPHCGAFEPDEDAIGLGVRAMAGWLAERARCQRHDFPVTAPTEAIPSGIRAVTNRSPPARLRADGELGPYGGTRAAAGAPVAAETAPAARRSSDGPEAPDPREPAPAAPLGPPTAKRAMTRSGRRCRRS